MPPALDPAESAINGHKRLRDQPKGGLAAVIPPLARKIVALLPDHETLTLGQIVQLTGGKPSTLKLRLRELVASGYLLPKGQGRGAYYLRAWRP